jgi:hypothetical protein
LPWSTEKCGREEEAFNDRTLISDAKRSAFEKLKRLWRRNCRRWICWRRSCGRRSWRRRRRSWRRRRRYGDAENQE